MEILNILKQDHEKVTELFKQIEDTTAKKSRKSLFDKLYKELDVHMRAEEDVFYPAMQQNEEATEKIMEAIEEHHVVRLLLEELKDVSTDDERWDAKIMVMKENVDHHVSEEENNIFGFCKEMFDKNVREELGEKFQTDKKSLKTHA